MSNAKRYHREELLDRAVELFRRRGFNGTSTAELVAELGVNRKSMYAEFGSKQGLFEAVLEHYDGHHLSRVLAPLEAPGAGLDEISNAFHGYASAAEGSFRGLGCLLCNTAVERAAIDPASGRFVDAYLARLESAFRRALGNSLERGEIRRDVDLDETAGFLTTLLVGVAAGIRAEAPPGQLRAASGVVDRVLDGLRENRQ